jgi:glyoxylase-like metal-dependent hydrolase (beta-lactamase superfamily II)
MVERWDIVTIGNISRNRYWGESEEVALRPSWCTSTLIRCGDARLLVDPPHEDAALMAAELDRRTGLKFDGVNLIFVTHAHADHHYGAKHFAGARWLAAPDVAAALNASGRYPRPFEPAPARLCDAIDVIHTPGHTLDHHSLRFDCDGLSVVIAGDAVMTRDFWDDRRGYRNSVDFGMASRTIEQLARIADVVVPGHDNVLLTRRSGR